jgi:hypothetical protein
VRDVQEALVAVVGDAPRGEQIDAESVKARVLTLTP